MLLYKLKELECSLEKETPQNPTKLKTVSALKNALLKIDFNAEEVPEYSLNKVIKLLEEINDEKLSSEEQKLLQLLINNVVY